MKKMMMILSGLFVLATTAVRADDDKPIAFEQLPKISQQFIKKHFPKEKVSFSKMERDFFDTKYQVVLVSGKKVEFLKNGKWKEVDCRYESVPEAIIPQQIASKVKELYPDVKVTEIDRDSRDYEVKLSNGMELTFDLKFNLIEVDN